MGVKGENRGRMIEMINGSLVTSEASHLSLLYQKIDRESKKYSPLFDQLIKSCEKFKSNVKSVSSSLSDVLAVLDSLSKACRSDGSSGLTGDVGDFLSQMVRNQSDVVESLDMFDDFLI